MGLAASRQEAFWEACGFGHKQRVQKFLEAGDIDVNWVSYTHDCCPIHVASQGKSEIVRMLLDANCNVNVQDIRGLTPVHHAAMKGHADIIKTLLEAGAEVNTQDKNNWTALHCAAYWNHNEAVRVLLNLGADVNILNKDKRTALHETARSKDKDDFSLGEITQMLISEGSDINCKGCSDLGDLEADFTGLMYAAYHNHPDVASALIDGGCEINANGSNLWTALHWAADRGHEEMVYLLLGAGADPTKRGQRNELAADRAEKSDLKEMLLNAVNMFNELEDLNGSKQMPVKENQSESAPEKAEFPKKVETNDIATKEDISANDKKDKKVQSSKNRDCDDMENKSNFDNSTDKTDNLLVSDGVDKLTVVSKQKEETYNSTDKTDNLLVSDGVDKLTLVSKQKEETVTPLSKELEECCKDTLDTEDCVDNNINDKRTENIEGNVDTVVDNIDIDSHQTKDEAAS